MSEVTVVNLKKEIDSLKKKLGAMAVGGLLIGSGGLFGIIKWVAADRQLTAAETRLKTVETEVLKLNTLTSIYEAERARIDAAELSSTSNKKLIEERKKLNDALQQEILNVQRTIEKGAQDIGKSIEK